jgi:hypothetical protein
MAMMVSGCSVFVHGPDATLPPAGAPLQDCTSSMSLPSGDLGLAAVAAAFAMVSLSLTNDMENSNHDRQNLYNFSIGSGLVAAGFLTSGLLGRTVVHACREALQEQIAEQPINLPRYPPPGAAPGWAPPAAAGPYPAPYPSPYPVPYPSPYPAPYPSPYPAPYPSPYTAPSPSPSPYSAPSRPAQPQPRYPTSPSETPGWSPDHRQPTPPS